MNEIDQNEFQVMSPSDKWRIVRDLADGVIKGADERSRWLARWEEAHKSFFQERDMLLSRLSRCRDYMSHHDDCRQQATRGCVNRCDCGFSDLMKEMRE